MTSTTPAENDDICFPPSPDLSGGDLKTLANLRRCRTWIAEDKRISVISCLFGEWSSTTEPAEG